MKLFNTLSRQVEPFQPQGETVQLYMCGITPYDTTHLGHAFSYVTIDTLIRYLEYRGYPVSYVQNVTDIDDDILRHARQVEKNWQELGNHWTRRFIDDMQALNVRPPDQLPRATDVIPHIINAVEAMLQAGVAYQSNGNVYFHVETWPPYGRLSRLSRPQMLPIANERGNDPHDPHKKDPLDFVLWQARQPGEPAWDTPWGKGRPGWHIECSTLANHFLGPTIDIHGGGRDLPFPHHESEIAQAETATGRTPFVHHWLHIAMVEHQGEKMSKSLGNLVMIRDLLETYPPDALRIYLAQHHYRQPWEHNEVELQKAAKSARKLAAAMEAINTGDRPINLTPIHNRFTAAMDNDLDTMKGVASLLNLADEIMFRAHNGYRVDEAQAALRRMAAVFGLRLNHETVEDRVTVGWQAHRQRFEASA